VCPCSLSVPPALLSARSTPANIALVVSSKYFYVPTISYTLPLYTLYIYLRGMYARARVHVYVCMYRARMYHPGLVHRSVRHIKSTWGRYSSG